MATIACAAFSGAAAGAVNPPPVMASSPLFGAWGVRDVGSITPKDFTVTVTSSQYDLAPLTDVRLVGPGASAYRVGGTCARGFELTRRTPCRSTVTFRPRDAGTFTAALVMRSGLKVFFPDATRSVACTDLSCELRIPLRGTAVQPGVEPPPTPAVPTPAVQVGLTPRTAVVAAGGATAAAISVVNIGGTTLAPLAVALRLPPRSRVVNGGGGRPTAAGVAWSVASLAPGGRAYRTVVYRIMDPRPRTSPLTVAAVAEGARASASAAVRVLPRRSPPARRTPVAG